MDTLIQLSICTIPFSLSLYSYSYYKNVNNTIKTGKNISYFFDKICPKYLVLLEKVLEQYDNKIEFFSKIPDLNENVIFNKSPPPSMSRPPTPTSVGKEHITNCFNTAPSEID